MIELTEEPYDGPVAVALISELVDELNARYADVDDPTEPADGDDPDAAYHREVTPDLVRRPQGAFVVAWLDGEPVATGAVKPLFDVTTHDPILGAAEIKRMYTTPRARRRGISRLVLVRLEEIAAELGYQRMVLETGTAQPEAVELYASAGWERTEPYGRFRESPWSVCFAKELPRVTDGESGRHAALVGATASGKSALALDLARRDPTWELVSADSMQVYRGMDIGTAKPSAAEQAEVRHHLIDVLDPWDDGTLAWFQGEAKRVIAEIEQRGRRALLVGGTALYVQAVVDDLEIPGQFPDARAEVDVDPDTAALYRRLGELDPVAAGRMEPGNRRRVVRALEVTLGSGRPFSSYGPGLSSYPESAFRVVGVARSPEDLAARIEARYAQQVEAGLVDEVQALRDDPRGLSQTAGQALGYKEVLDHLDGRATLDEALDLAIRRTRRFARRQRAWFRRDPRIAWLEAPPGSETSANLLVDALVGLVG